MSEPGRVRLADGDVERVRAQADLVRIAGVLLPEGVVKDGKEWKGRCPWHSPDKKPSFYIVNKRGRWLCGCFSCVRHEDVFGLVGSVLGIGFVESVEWVAKEAGVEIGGSRPAASAGAKASGVDAGGPRLRPRYRVRAQLFIQKRRVEVAAARRPRRRRAL